MPHIPFVTSRARRAAPLLALAAGVLVAAGALGAGAADGEPAADGYVVVRHVLYVTEDGTIAYDEESRDTVSAQFVVNNHIWSLDSVPVQVAFNADGAPSGHDTAGIIQEALGKWNAAGSNFAFAWAGDSDGDTGSCAANLDVDGVNTIRFEQLPGLTLGQTCTLYPIGNNSRLVEFDMQLDTDANWTSATPVQGGKYDLRTTILHELGHAAGLGHSAQSAAVMYFQVNAGQDKRTLMQDDLNAIVAAYGGNGVPTATPTHTATPTPTTPAATTTTSPSPTASATPPPITTVPVIQRARAPQLARD